MELPKLGHHEPASPYLHPSLCRRSPLLRLWTNLGGHAKEAVALWDRLERLDPDEIGVVDVQLLLEPQVKVKSTPPEPPPMDEDPDPDPMSERSIAAEEALELYVGGGCRREG